MQILPIVLWSFFRWKWKLQLLPEVQVPFRNAVADPAVSLGEVVLAALHSLLFTPPPCRSLNLPRKNEQIRLQPVVKLPRVTPCSPPPLSSHRCVSLRRFKHGGG